jgi:fibronectin-binding autotransporter adhesin
MEIPLNFPFRAPCGRESARFPKPSTRQDAMSTPPRIILALAASSLHAVSSASAQTPVNWEGDDLTSNLWATAANWDAAPTSDLTANIASFNLASYGTNPVWAPTVGTATSIAGITIGSSNGAMTLTTGGFLTIGASGISIANGAGAFTLSGSTTLGAAQAWTNSSANPFTFGTVSNGTNLLTIDGSGNSIATGDIGSGSSSGGLTKDGAGKFTLQAASTRTGATVIDGGTLRIENATAFGTTAAAITINNGGTFEIGTSTALAATTSTGTINLNNGGTISSGLAGAAARIDKTINLQASATGVFTFDSGSNASNVLTINGGNNSRLAGGATGAQIQITGSGIVDVGETGQTRTTAVTADWYLQGGRLRMRADSEIGAAANDFYFQGGTLLTDAAFTLGTSRVLNFNHVSGGTVDTTGGNLTLGTAGQLNGSNRLAKAGSNSLIISAANTGFSGGVTFNGGTVQANHATALGSSGNLTFSGGTLQYTASSAVTDWAARIKNSSSAIILDSNGQTISLAGIIDNTNAGGLTKTGTGTLQLSGANTYTGTTTVTQGILSLDFTGGSNRINSGSALQLGGGTLQFTELGTNTQTFGSTTLNSATASSITRSGAYTSGVSDLGTLSGSGTLDVSNLTVSPTWIKASGNVSQTYLLNGQVTANSGASFVRTDASGNLFTVATSDFANNAIIGNNAGTSIRLVAGGSAGTGPTGSGFVGLSTVGTTDFDSILNRYTTGTVTIDVTNSGANASNILRLGSYGPMSSSFGAALTVGTDVANGGFLTAGGADDTAGTIYVNGSNNTTINSVIQNNGTGVVGLNKDGSGTLTLAGTNTYTGGTTINGGTLQGTTTSTSLTPPNPLGSGGITLNGSGAVLQLRASGTLNTTAETIQFNNNVTVGGDATIDVNRPGATSTTKTIQLGTLSIGANTLGVTGGNSYALRFNGATTLTGNATFNVANIYNNNPSLTLAGAVGDGSAGYSLTKTGAGILALSGNNTFSGGVSINAGTLQVASAANLGDSANVVTFTGAGTLQFTSNATFSQGFAINAGVTGTLSGYDKTVTINNSLAGSGTLTALGSGTSGGYFTFNSTNNTFSGDIVIYSGSGASYSAGLTMNSLADTPGKSIRLGNNNSTPAFSYGAGAVAPLVLNNRQIVNNSASEFGAFLNNNATDVNSTVTVNTDLIMIGSLGSKPFTLGGSNTGNNTFAGGINDGAGYAPRLTKAGAGRWILSNTNNSYTGTTTINGGTLSINSITNVGAGASAVGAPTTVANGTIAIGSGGTAGTLQYTGGAATTDRVINLAGSTGGAILDQSGTGLLKFTSDFTATVAGTKTLTLQGSTAGTGEIAGAIVNGSGTTALAKAGTGTWTLSGTSSFTGGTTVSAGTLVLGHATDTLANTGAVTVNGTGVLSIGGNSDTVGAVTLAGGSITGTGGTLTGTSYAVQSGSVSAKLGGAVTLTKTTAGTVTLSGANTYTGGTIVNAGNLTLAFGGGASNIISPSSALTMGGGTLQLTGTGTQTFNGLSTTASTNSAIVLGADQTLTLGALTSAGAGSYLNFNTTAGGANGATVGSGIVVLTGRTPGNVINAGYTVTDVGGFGLATVNESNQVIRLAAGTLLPPSGATSGNNYFVDNNAGGPAAAGSSSLVVSATQAAASVTVDTTASSGTLTLNSGFFMESNLWNFGGGVGANSYTINGPGSLRSVASGNTITLNNYNTGLVTVAAPIAASGTNPVTLTGSGTTVFSGNNTYTGLTTVSAGVLIIQHNNALGTTAGGVNVATGAALQMQNNITVGNEALTLNGTGIGNTGALRNISGSNTYGGLVTLGSATRINSDAGTLTLDVSSGSAFTGTHNLTIGGAGNVTVADPVGTGSGTLTKDGAGILTLNAVNTYTGLTTVSDGTLVLGHATNTLAGGPVTVNGAGAVLSIGNNTDTVGVVTLVSGSISGTGGTLTGTSYAMQSGSASANLAGGGTVTLTKSTSGIVTLSGTNTYTGTTTVTGGVLRLNSANALPGGIASTGGVQRADLERRGGRAGGRGLQPRDGNDRRAGAMDRQRRVCPLRRGPLGQPRRRHGDGDVGRRELRAERGQPYPGRRRLRQPD